MEGATLSISVPFQIYCEETGDAPADPSSPLPVLLTLHGYAMDAVTMLSLTRPMVPAGWLLVSVQGPHTTLVPGSENTPARKNGFHWGVSPNAEENRAAHRDAVTAAIAWAVDRGGDPARISLLGFSQPCSFNYRLAMEPPHGRPFRSLVAICGGIPGEWSTGEPGTNASSKSAALHVSTREDPFYPLEKVMAFPERLGARFKTVRQVLRDGGHRIPSAASEEVRRFLSEQR